MQKTERVMAVLSGKKPDRPPLGFWHHFGPHQRSGQAAVAAHLAFFERYDLDFLKVMNDNGYPREGGEINSASDLTRLKQYSGDEGPFGAQLEVLRALKARLGGQVLMTTTVFNPWTVLRRLMAPEPERHGPPSLDFSGDVRDRKISAILKEDQSAAAAALMLIARSLGNFARRCLEAGADGIYLSVRDDWADTPANGKGTYAALARPADMEVLGAAAAGTFNMLHVCGRALDFKAFAEYPVPVLSWADRYAGPAIRDAAPWLKPAVCAGIDNLHTLVHGTPDQCRAEALDALAQAGERPIIVAPGCTFDPDTVPEANLRALCAAVR